MDKKIAGLLGAAAALATMNGAQAAAPTQQTPTAAGTYRDLLEPIPNAVELLNADNAALAARSGGDVKIAQMHHHHHHHGYRRPPPRVFVRRPHHHHHHHHHRSGFSINIR